MSMLNLKELDSMHLSVLAEIGNIGSGNAATALAGLLNTPVDIEVPNICLMDYTKAADYLGGADKTAIGMTVNVKGDMNGVMLQIVEKEFTSRLINTFYEKNVDSIDSLNDMDLSVLREMANITTAAYVNSIAKMTNTFIDIESGYSNGKTSAIVYPSKIGDITVNKNIYYFTYREYPAFLIRVASAAESKVTIAENNYAYLFETGLNLNVFQNKIGDTSVGFTSNDVDLYDTTDPATFNKSTGTFIPKEGYTQYGAQR